MLSLPAQKGYYDITKMLLDNGIKLTRRTKYAIKMAIEKGHQDIADLIKSYEKSN
jgi:predicted oxidoreductase (fatty acid repression mutant protein)